MAASGVKVLLGNGSGGFSAGPQSPSGGCRFAEARDVNRDGKLGLVGIGRQLALELGRACCSATARAASRSSGPPWIDGGEGPVGSSGVGRSVTRDGRPDLVVGYRAGRDSRGPLGRVGPAGPGQQTRSGRRRHTSLPERQLPARHRPRRLQPRRDPGRGVSGWLLAGKPDGTLAAPVPGTQPAETRPRRGRPRRQRHAGPHHRAIRARGTRPTAHGASSSSSEYCPAKATEASRRPMTSRSSTQAEQLRTDKSRSLLVADFDRDGKPDLATAGNFVTGSDHLRRLPGRRPEHHSRLILRGP